MGEVYRARDSKLQRDVAIKVLPDVFAQDPERLARFSREAQTLAALNHPGIAHIHGFEESGGVRALVMELVEGDDLSVIIARGPMPLAEALPIAKQIAEALEAAHELGIVHRDLKPANIKVRPDGTVKVLDFGLATALDPTTTSGADVANSPTLTARATQMGMILGTAAYMAPEQARGRAVDRRADIWAFGAVLFEMLTGRRAFEGDDVSTTIAAVLKDDVKWATLPPDMPAALRQLLQRCLERDPKRRLQAIAEARIALDDIASGAATEPEAAPAQPVRQSRVVLPWMVAAVLGALVIALGIVALRPARADGELRLDIATPSTQAPLDFALSPDGQSLAFVATASGFSRLWVRRLDKTDAQPLTGTDGASMPFWSADSRSLGFFSNTKLRRIDIAGGAQEALADGFQPGGGAWNTDNVILFSARRVIYQIPASGGSPVAVTKLDLQQTNHRSPQFLPDGRHFLIFVNSSAETRGVYAGSLGDPRLIRLTNADSAATYLPPDRLLFMRESTMYAQHFDASRLSLSGQPEIVTTNLGNADVYGQAPFSVSATGRIAYRGGAPALRRLTRLDRAGKPLGFVGDADASSLQAPVMSPDGRRIAVDRTIGGNRDIWLMDVERGGMTRFTFDPNIDGFPVWSPDGSQVAFESNRSGAYDLYAKPANNSGVERPLLEAPGNQWPQDWSSDGRYLLYSEADAHNGDLMALPLTGTDRKPMVVANSEFSERTGAIAPNSHWVAYDTNESGRFEIVVQSFPVPGAKWQVSTAGGVNPRWNHDGTELYFISPDLKLMAVKVRAVGETLEAQPPQVLFQTHVPTTNAALFRASYAVAADGTFLVDEVLEQTSTPPITLLLNWRPK